MPVDLLLCEGGANSPDIRVLKKLLAGYCGEIRPMGGRYGMGDKVLARREAMGNEKIAGLLDGDFLSDWEEPLREPRPWQSGDGKIRFGWRWSRKEIENYLLDPVVVSHALGERAPSEDLYIENLEAAVERISVYEAARTALSNCRRRFQNLPANWGRKRGRDKHPFPEDLTEAACRDGIRETVQGHVSTQIITVEEVVQRYEELLPEFREGGRRRRDYLWTYAGKDLLIALDDSLKNMGFPSWGAFRERVLLGIEGAAEDVATWVLEWSELRTAIESF